MEERSEVTGSFTPVISGCSWMLVDAVPDTGLGLGVAVEEGGSSSWGAACRVRAGPCTGSDGTMS